MFHIAGGRQLKAGALKAVPDPIGMHKSQYSVGRWGHYKSPSGEAGGLCLHLSVPCLEVEALVLGFLGGQEAPWEKLSTCD